MKGTFWPIFLLFFLLEGCSTTKSHQKNVVTLPPTVFIVKKGKVVKTEEVTPEDLFNRARIAFNDKKYSKACHLYKKLLHLFPHSEFNLLTHYNLALSLERDNHFEEALKHYRIVKQRVPHTETGIDASFRIGANLLKLKRWVEAEKLYSKLIHLKKLPPTDRIELFTRLGTAQLEQHKFNLAQENFRKALRIYRKASKKEFLEGDYFAAQAQFSLGKIYEQHFKEKKLSGTQEELKRQLELKARDWLAAYNYYIKAIKLKNAHWIVVSLYRIAQLHWQMYNDMVNAPLPKGLTKEEQTIYVQLLKKKIRVLLNRAVNVFERNLQIAENFGLNDDKLVQKTKKDLAKLRTYIVKEFLSEPQNPLKSSPKKSSSPSSSSQPHKKENA